MDDVERLLEQMTLSEKASLTAGADVWSTVAIERLGIPPVWLTDGPNGARGTMATYDGRPLTGTCVPCGSALGATWDVDLVGRVGALIGADARAKGCRVLLAPTVNLHRSPLGGRNFESYSEDPLLAGRLAAAFVRGAQSQGVAVTVKHFAGNESEFERMTMDAVIADRTLRELYLMPFELAVREGGALGVMSAYNRLNGVYCSDSETLLRDILRGEWGFEGFVVTDWRAAGTTVGAARAGMDLEMPGPGRFFGPALADAVQAGQLEESYVDDAVRRLLTVFARIGALSDPVDRAPASIDRPEDRALCRAAASSAAVLLSNDGVLPMDPRSLRSVAVIGPNAARAQIMGGGSARLPAHYRVAPLDVLRERLGADIDLVYEPGIDIARMAPALRGEQIVTPDGQPGVAVDVFEGHDCQGDVVDHFVRGSTELAFTASDLPVRRPDVSLRASCTFTPEETGPHTFALSQRGRGRLLVDGQVLLDGFASPPPPGGSFLGSGSVEATATVELVAGVAVDLVIEFANIEAPMLAGVRVGCRRPPVPDLLDRAVAAAKNADVAVVVVGTTREWESEGFDRESMQLPAGQHELVERIIEANPRTVVVVNAGSVVDMSWADGAAAVLQIWLGGQEMSNALVDVLLGDSDPGGRLPTTIPVCLEHNPSFGNFPAENGRAVYGEGVLVGYRWYDTRRLPVRFPFGHGLSYSTFTIGTPRLSSSTFSAGGRLTLDVDVTNNGPRAGSEVVQCYVAPSDSRVLRPNKELKGFAKVHLAPGETTTAHVELDDRAFAYWDERQGWTIEPGDYDVLVGRSSADIASVVSVRVD